MHKSMLKLNPDNYGFYYFTPKNLLNWLEISHQELSTSKVELVKSEGINSKEIIISDIVPDTFDENKRVIPNIFLRSAIFGIVRKGRRETLKNKKVPSMSQYEVFFTGEQLDQNDLAVWDSLTYLAKKKNIVSKLETSIYEICKIVDLTNCKSSHDSINTRIERLKSASVKIRHDKKFYVSSLIDGYFHDENTGKSIIKFNSDLLSIFETKDYTLCNKKIKDELGDNQLSRWLFGFYESHIDPIPFNLEYLRNLCGSKSDMKEFKRKIKISFESIKNIYAKYNVDFAFYFKNDDVIVRKVKANILTY